MDESGGDRLPGTDAGSGRRNLGGLRDILPDLEAGGELRRISRPTDIRHIATLVDQSETALLFTNVIGYDMPVISGVMNSRERLGVAMGCDFSEIEALLRRGLATPIAPETIAADGLHEMIQEGGEVDLFNLPVPIFGTLDGGPMITAGVIIAHDEEFGYNAGVYRLLVKDRNTTGIDIVTPNNLRKFAEKALARDEALPISINIGTHPAELIAATFKAAAGVDEMALAGGMRGAPVQLAPCQSVDIPFIADSEIVLEAEILPTGWTKPEGRFGEFTRLMGGLHWNPHVRIKAIRMRPGPVYYALHMPWENIWPSGPIYESAVRRVLHEAGVQVTAINVTPGGCCHWHTVAAIKPLPGDGKNAIAAMLSVADMKHVTVVDEDIDVFDHMDVEWAVATRVQADKDVVIISGARSKPLDPSLVPTPGRIPTTAKMGIDATIPVDVPRERFERIHYAYSDEVRLADALGDGAAKEPAPAVGDNEVTALAVEIRAAIDEAPQYFFDLSEMFADRGFQALSRAIGQLHENGELWQDKLGRFCLTGSEYAAEPG
ncbi:MAG: UbiD family decarboxylase [Rhodospirillales bacterium]|nr:UbiD family decarboxylase [Rhodospirillales bacterium]MDP6643867.1 UbiD family decarboxylase [Rhodospirillales bacterium]